MAPYQCPKQVLIWSLPTLAVLISLFWYRRRKPSLKSDPGGKFAKATQPLHPVTTAVDNSCNGIKQTAAVAVNSETAVGELLTAIEKARRDFETAQPIEEEEAGAAASVRDVKEKQQLVASAASAAAATPNQQTLTTSSNRTPIKKSTGVNGVVEESNQTVVSDKVCEIVKQVEQQIESVSVIENCEKIVEEGESDLSKIQQTGEQLKKRPVAEEVFTAVAVHKQEAAPGVGVVVDLDSSGLSDDCVIVDSKPPSPSEVSNSVVEEVIDLTSSSESLADVSAKLVDQKEQKMALEVEIKQPLMEQQQQLSSSDRSQLSAIGLDQSGGHTAHDDGERDSANHSPAEIMLESPALRNFSDVHSEGSSDSGKGCSDVATPPAGGSSVAGDGEPTAAGVFEFIIPQHLVGRLIGRHGAFLQEIRTTTHTNVFIKRHPDTAKLKICAIEGAQADIDAALSMIRHKFPLRRYPTLTLEKVTFVQVAPTCELAPDQFRLQLVEGVNNDVILSSLVSAGHMFLQQPTHPSFQQLAALNQVINANYCFNDSPSLDEPVKDGVCVAPAPMGGWYRAQIVNVNDDEKTVDLRFLDYGGYISCEYTILKKMRYDFLMLPFQAVECYLANITPVGGPGSVWSEEATLFVQNLIYGKILQAQIYDYMEDGMPLIYLYATCGNQVVLVNQELVASGYAEPVTPVAAAVAQPEQEVKVEE